VTRAVSRGLLDGLLRLGRDGLDQQQDQGGHDQGDAQADPTPGSGAHAGLRVSLVAHTVDLAGAVADPLADEPGQDTDDDRDPEESLPHAADGVDLLVLRLERVHRDDAEGVSPGDPLVVVGKPPVRLGDVLGEAGLDVGHPNPELVQLVLDPAEAVPEGLEHLGRGRLPGGLLGRLEDLLDLDVGEPLGVTHVLDEAGLVARGTDRGSGLDVLDDLHGLRTRDGPEVEVADAGPDHLEDGAEVGVGGDDGTEHSGTTTRGGGHVNHIPFVPKDKRWIYPGRCCPQAVVQVLAPRQ